MRTFITNNWEFLVSITVTILGLVITGNRLTKSFKLEISKSKRQLSLDKMADIPYRILKLAKEFKTTYEHQSKETEDAYNEYEDIINTILSYGSPKAILIASYWASQNALVFRVKEIVHHSAELKEKEYVYVTKWSIYSLLITQIKHDLTDELIPIDSYFNILVNPTRTFESLPRQISYVPKCNDIIDELELDKKMKLYQRRGD